MIKNVYYNICSDKIIGEKTAALFADIHFSDNFKLKRLDKVNQNLSDHSPRCIFIPGDVIDNLKIETNKEMLKKLLEELKELGQIANTYISIGNHDYNLIGNNTWTYIDKPYIWNQIGDIEGINVLDNRNVVMDELNIMGYTPSDSYYHNPPHKDDPEVLIRELPEINTMDDKYNVLMFHSPRKILTDEVVGNVDKLKSVDLILSGHMHNGLIPPIFDSIYKGHKGLIAPNKDLFPLYSRGMIHKQIGDHEMDMIITGGITKVSEHAGGKLSFINNLYPMSIDYITLKKKDIPKQKTYK